MIVVALLVVPAGCSAAEPERRAAGDKGRLPAYDVNPVPRDQVRVGGTLRWPMPEFATQWNANHLNGARGVVDQIIQGMMPFLVRSDPKGVPHPVPEYLSSAKVTATKPKQVVTYTLNPKARWSNGTAITYRDFAAQAAALSGRDKRFQVATVTGYEQVEKVARGADDHQAVVTFKRPYADWMGLFSPLYPAATNSDPAAFNQGWLNRLQATAGPFTVERIDRTAKTVSIARDPRWWGRPAKLDRIVFRAMDTAAMPGAFESGEADILDIGVDASAYKRARQVRGAVIRRAGGPDWRHFTFNAASKPLTDRRVRQAVMMGINRRAIAESDLKDLGWPAQTLDNHFFMNTQQGYQDNSENLGRYDPARARRLLDEAGWPQDGKYRAKDGETLALRFVVPAAVPTSKQEGELAQAMLAQIGVRLDIRPVPPDEFFENYITTGEFDIVPFSWLGNPFPVSSLRSVFISPRGDHIQQNYSRTGSPSIDTAMDQAIQNLNPTIARRQINEADRLIWRQASVLPLYQRPQLIAVRSGLANFGAPGFYDLPYEDIGFTSR